MAEPRECKRCKEVRKIVGRNLCHPCYGWLKDNGQLDLFPIRKGNEPFAEIRIDRDGNQTKQCTKCKEWKELASSFGKNSQSSVGYNSWCRECQRIASGNRYAPKKEAIKEAKQSVYQDGLKKCKKCEEYKSVDNYTPHPDRWDGLNHVCRKCSKKIGYRYRQATDKVAVSKRSSAWYYKNKDRRQQKDREWRKNNPDKSRAIWHRYKTRKMEAEGDFAPEQWKAVKDYYCPDGLCLDCKSKKRLTADHIIPLCQGGSNSIDNIQPLCGNCNSKKGRWHTTDFRPDKGEFARALMNL